MDLYLRADTQRKMENALIKAGFAYKDDDGNLMPAYDVSLDVVGEIPDATGYHVNVLCAALSEDQESAITDVRITPPDTPYRVWMR
jgi:hypothetical protein